WLNGIFAFSIYDTFEQRLWLCRDHLGIKPLFISRSQEHLFWGSELKTVTSLYDKDSLQINEESIPYFLHLGYIPEPMTIYRGVEKFPAGHFAQYDLKTGKWEQASYWQAADHYLKQHDIDEENALRTFRDKLYAAVERQMVSDVPLGTFLSGGIDSSLVTAVASQVHKGKVKSFSIGFTDTAFDESEYATQVANHLQSEHHLFKVTQDDILELIPEFISVYDEPFADSSAFPTMLVSRLAREHVTVTLSGDGGDELFQGYGMYQWAARLHQPMVELWRKPLYQLSKLLPLKYQRAGRLFDYPDRAQVPSHIFS